jgi:MYXO-CTERM domain-containing protein
MNNSIALLAFALAAVTGGAFQAQGASATGLADWCVSINGDINTACNGAGAGGASPLGGSISLAGFDQTLEPNTNNLGTVVVTLAPGANQHAALYADYDLDDQAFGFFQDSASVHGALPAGVSYELADQNVSNIFSDFAGNALPDVNSVGTPSAPPVPCCDVSFALAVGGLTVAPGGSGTVTFRVSTTVPVSGFYIQQTNFDAGDSIYLSEVTTITNPTGATPEPSTFALGLGAMGVVLAAARRQRRRV